jgi:ABC transport system ATP-binding/permease protein
MSENILKALMQLFAIIAREDGVTSSGRKVVELFLRQQISQDQVDKYLLLFDQFLEDQNNSARKKNKDSAKASVKDSVRVLRICTQINSELAQKQKFIVLVRLLEFINADKQISEQEMEFVITVASTFNIPDSDFSDIKAFILNDRPEPANVLLIARSPRENYSRFIASDNLQGELWVLYIQGVDLYLTRFSGDTELYLNGTLLRKNQIYVLTHGCSVRSTRIAPLYYSDIVSRFLKGNTRSRITFDVNRIEYVFKGGRQGLHELTLHEESGRMVGIMGASGAGKSTLLNILNGIDAPAKGEVLLNGINIHRENKKVKGLIGFISQDDLLIEELSVYENLFYNARLCFGNKTEAEIRDLVSKTLEDIGLFEIRDIKVGSPLNKKISGGQRKRLNIALELIRQPFVLFVDEPTSGLSSRDSENIMDLLKELSLKGKLVFVVIHQPSSDIYKMFDRMLILDTGGYPVYYGNPVEAVSYFKRIINHVNSEESECIQCGNVNPEQIFNIIESKVVDEYGILTRTRKIAPRQWNLYYREKIHVNGNSGEKPKPGLPESSFRIPGRFGQFKVFLTRDVLSKLSNTQYMVINFLEAPFLAFILAFLVRYSPGQQYVFKQNENLPAYLFMNIIVALFMGLTVSAEEIIRDRKILKRESFLNLSWSGYLSSKIFMLFCVSAVQTLSFVLLGNYILDIKGMTFDYWFVLFAVSCFANMLGLNISASFNSAVTIYILIPILLIPQLLLSGVIVEFDKLNPSIASQKQVPVSGEMMVSRWAFEALAVNQFVNNGFERDFYELDRRMSEAEYKKNYLLPTLTAKLDYCAVEENKGKPAFENNLRTLSNELGKRQPLKLPASVTLPLTASNIAGAVTPLKTYINRLSEYYSSSYNKADKRKNRLITELCRTPQAEKAFLERKGMHENDNLSELVRNSKRTEKIVEENGELIQKSDPIFAYPRPEGTFDFRTHFFAPVKYFMNNYLETYWFNVAVIWIMSLILYVALYFEWLKKAITGLESLFRRVSFNREMNT